MRIKVSVKTNGSLVALGFVCGLLLGYKLFNRTVEPLVQAVSDERIVTKTVTKTVLPNGTIVLKKSTREAVKQVAAATIGLSKYRAYIGLGKSFGAAARLGNLPLFIELGYSLDYQRVEARLIYEY